MDHFTTDGAELLSDSEVAEASDTKIQPGDSDVVIMIKELIESRYQLNILTPQDSTNDSRGRW
jgi:hypothetical protein